MSHELEIVADHLAVKFLARSPRNSLIRSARTCRSTFDGFGDFILPWSDGIVPAITKPLSLEKLLPWIGDGWDAQTCVDGLNYMIDKNQCGETLFYSYYSNEKKAADPSREDTGMVFLKGEEGAPFAVVCPGGRGL